ncbi:hypothetical protein AGMMS50212_12320 [Spirochaetia bacterium]|nr:hypothetical protein AGMMS50212_12320 [Spirochaetia bacterium]
MVTIYTIGYTHKTAKYFFEKLLENKINTVIDIRLNNQSQLTGFTKKQDLEYFLKKICGIAYLYMPQFAPTKEILDAYKKKRINWSDYERYFNALIYERKIEKEIDSKILNDACLLCSEDTPDKCHRRLVAEYFSNRFENIKIIHL